MSIVAAILMSLVCVPFAFADNENRGRGKHDANSPALQALQENIKKLKEQLEEMLKQRKELLKAEHDAKKQLADDKKDLLQGFGNMDLTKQQLKFVRSLVRGMSGDDVRDLQELLAQDPDIFDAANVTGFFGPLTEAAVKKFQKKHGIESIGVFGPKTQAKILALFVGKPLPPGIAKRLGLANASTTPGAGFLTVCHKPAGVNPHTLVIAVPALGAHLGHGDTVGVCAGGTGTTTPDTTKPTLSSITATPGATTATIMWTTNEGATSEVLYGLTSGYGSSTSNSTLLTSHSVLLNGLMPSTLYHFQVKSADATGNVATSSDMTFTSAAADTTAPHISSVNVAGLSSTTATVSWATNESATGKLYLGTATPITFTETSHATVPGTSHTIHLTELTASTTYYYAIEAKDAANNTATTTTQSFVTAN